MTHWMNTDTPRALAHRSSWQRRAVSSLFWLAFAALSVVFVAALGVVTTAAG